MDWLKRNWKTIAIVSGSVVGAGLIGFLIKRRRR